MLCFCTWQERLEDPSRNLLMVGGRDPALLESMTIVPGTRRDSNEGEEGKANDLRVHKFFRNIFTRMHLASLGEAWWLMPKTGEAGKAGDAMQLLLLTGDEGTWIQLLNDGILNVKLGGKCAS